MMEIGRWYCFVFLESKVCLVAFFWLESRCVSNELSIERAATPVDPLSVTLAEVTITGKQRLAASAFYPSEPGTAGFPAQGWRDATTKFRFLLNGCVCVMCLDFFFSGLVLVGLAKGGGFIIIYPPTPSCPSPYSLGGFFFILKKFSIFWLLFWTCPVGRKIFGPSFVFCFHSRFKNKSREREREWSRDEGGGEVRKDAKRPAR